MADLSVRNLITTLSTDKITINKYETNFYFETMVFNKDEFVDIVDNMFFKKLLSEFTPSATATETATETETPTDMFNTIAAAIIPTTAPAYVVTGKTEFKYMKDITTSVEDTLASTTKYNTDNIYIITGAKSSGIKQFTLIKENSLINYKEETPHIIERFLLIDLYREIFANSMLKLWRTQTDTLFILPCFNTDDNGVSRLSTTLHNKIKTLYEAIFDKNDTDFELVDLPNAPPMPAPVEGAPAEGAPALVTELKKIKFNKNIASDNEIALSDQTEDLKRTKRTNQILFIHALPDNTNEPIDSYKNKISEDIDIIEKTILNRANNAGRKRPFKQIIYFINPTANDTMFTDYFTTTIKKKYADEFNKLFNAYINKNKIGSQGVDIKATNKNKIRLFSDTPNLIKHAEEKFPNQRKDVINKPEFKLNVGLLLSKLKTLYEKRINTSITKQLTSQDNSSLFNIYMRFSMLDQPIITNKIAVSKNVLYRLFKNGVPVIGYFNKHNESQQQYTFILDRTQNRLYKDTDEYKTEYLKIFETNKTKRNDAIASSSSSSAANIEKYTEEAEEAIQEAEAETADAQKSDEPSENNTSPLIPEKSFLVEIRYSYGKIQYRDIQKSLTSKYDNENYITYYSERNMYEYYQFFKHKMIDTSLKDSIDIKYFINTKYTIANLKEFLISEKIYKDTTRLALEFLKINVNDPLLIKYNNFIFEKFKNDINTNNSRQDAFNEETKKSITEIIFEPNSLIYVRITSTLTEKEKEKATPDSFKIAHHDYESIKNKDNIKANITTYTKFNDEKTHFKDISGSDTPSDLKQQLNNIKKTFAFAIVQITKDVLSDPVKLYFSTQCKSRKKKIIEGYYKLTSIGGAKRTRNKKNKKKIKRKATKRRRIYFSKFPKG